MLETRFTQLVKVRFPIVQAGMAGGITTPELVAAVSNAGGLGTIGGGYLTPDQLRESIHRVRELTDRPFAVNLFAPQEPTVSDDEVRAMAAYLDEIRRDLGIKESPSIKKYAESFEEQVEVVIEERVPVFSFTFGIPRAEILDRLREHGSTLIGTATTPREAIALEQCGVDAIVVQGSEAGGHRGTFLEDVERSLIGTMALVPQVVDRVSVPVIASGGIMDGRGLVACLALGAAAVQMGTAFLACPESGAHRLYKQRILQSEDDTTEVTRAYSGKPARGVRTRFMERMRGYSGPIPAYPVQNALTRDIRQEAAKRDDPEYMSLWAGQAHPLATAEPAATIVQRTMEEAAATLRGLLELAGR
jgi:nitronate monooxygenase